MKKSIFLFTVILFMIAGGTSLVACSNDDDLKKVQTTEYGYISQILISDDVLKLYSDVTATFTYPDNTIRTVMPVSNEIIDRYMSREFGNVVVKLEGNLRLDAVDESKSYKIGFHEMCKAGALVLFNDFEYTEKGSVLKEKHAKLSSFTNAKYTFEFKEQTQNKN